MSDPARPEDASTGRLIAEATQDISTIIRTEMALAKEDLATSGKRLGRGAGLFGVAGTLALYGVGALVAAAILALSLVLDAWLAALVVAVAVLALAGVAALVGKSNVSRVTEPQAERKVSVRQDVAAVTEHDPSGGTR